MLRSRRSYLIDRTGLCFTISESHGTKFWSSIARSFWACQPKPIFILVTSEINQHTYIHTQTWREREERHTFASRTIFFLSPRVPQIVINAGTEETQPTWTTNLTMTDRTWWPLGQNVQVLQTDRLQTASTSWPPPCSPKGGGGVARGIPSICA